MNTQGTHEVRYFLVPRLNSMQVSPNNVASAYMTLPKDEDAKLTMLAEKWHQILDADPYKLNLCCCRTHYLVADIGVSKPNGLGASDLSERLILLKPLRES